MASRNSKEPLRVTRLQLENWRNFRAVDVPLSRRVFLVGPNASGKSNFLDTFRFLRALAPAALGLSDAVGARGGISSVRCLAARKNPAVGIDVDVGNTADPKRWRYLLRLSQDNRRRPQVKEERVERNGHAVLVRPDDDDSADPERLTQTAFEQVTANREFRELVSFFERINYLHIVPQVVREPERWRGAAGDPFGGDFLERVARTQQRTRDSRLRRILSALRTAVPQLETLEPHLDESGVWHLRGKYKHWRPTGKLQSEAEFSDGTLRLFGLLWALLDGTGPLLLEEPELSLHGGVVRHLPQMFARMQQESKRQIVVSTHSPELLHDSGIGLDEVLLLNPSEEGTTVNPAASLDDAAELLAHGVGLDEIVIPRTAPPRPEQLAMFGA